MEKSIIIKEVVFNQLYEEYLFISENYSIDAAEKFRIEFFEKIKNIFPFYNRFPVFKLHNPIDKKYRQIVWNNYLIVFKISKEVITILALFHTKQNPTIVEKL